MHSTQEKKKPNTDKRHQEVRRFLEKIVVNVGVGKLGQQQNFETALLPEIKKQLSLIAGQAPHVRPMRKSIAGFRTREGQTVGLRVTLRGVRMVDFFERLIKMVMPRVRDFRGTDLKVIDEGGALNLGFREQFVFPEVNAEETRVTFPLGVNVVPRKKNREEAIQTYRRLGMPLKKSK